MGFKLKQQTYDWRHFIIIPFQCEPVGTICVSLQKILTGFTAVFQVPITAKFIDSAIQVAKRQSSYQDTFKWLILLMACVGYRRVSFVLGKVFIKKVQVYSEKNMLMELTDKRAKLSYNHIEDPETWDLINRVCKDVDKTISNTLQRFLNIILYGIRIAGVLIIISTQVWWIGALILVLCMPLIAMSIKSGGKNYIANKLAAEYERKHKYFSDVLSGREAINERALFGYSEEINKIWYEQFEASRKISLKASRSWSMHIFMSSGVTSIISGIIMLSFVQPTIAGQISIGMFMALATGVYDLIDLMGMQMIGAVSNLAKSREYLRELTVFAALSETEGALDQPQGENEICDSIEFRNVSFKYPKTDVYILKGVSFTLEKGSHYAFVGANGAGKTTITKLMTGLYEEYEGEILINNKNRKEYSQAQLKSLFTGIYQDFAKYFITVRENIMLGDILNINNDSKDKEMTAITQSLGVYDDILSLTQKFDTSLGKIDPKGVDLSGGQWQKIAMARATISSSPVQILDEPTASLDPISESKLYEQFSTISKDKTTIFISHRLGSTKLAEKIFVLRAGKIAEEGSHEELMTLGGLYSEMYDSQRSWYQ